MKPIASLLLLLLALPLCRAREIPPDVSTELNDARHAWRDADALAPQIVKAAAEGSSEVSTLLEKRDALYDRANESFNKALDKDRSNPQANFEFGKYWIARGDFNIARHYLEDAWLSDFDAKPDVKGRLKVPADASIERCGNRAERSFTEAEKADLMRTLGSLVERAGESATALACYNAALKRDPVDPRNRISLACAHYAAGNIAETETLLTPWDIRPQTPAKDAALPPDFPQQRVDILALGLYTLALAKEQSASLTHALELYREAERCAQAPPENREVAESARLAAARVEDLLDVQADQAKQREDRLAAIKVENARIEKENAAKPPQEQRRLKVEPPDEVAQMREALALHDAALKLKKQALRAPPFMEALGKLRLNTIKANDLESLPEYGLFQTAESMMQQAAMKWARHARIHYDLALNELLLHRYSSARTLLDAAALYNPNDIATLNLRGAVLLELGQWEQAASTYRRLLSLDGDNGMAHFGLGRALAALKNSEPVCEAALESFQRAVRLGVRDERLNVARAIRTKDGQIFSGQIAVDATDYLVKEEYAAPFKVAKADVEELIEGPGLREQMVRLISAFHRGEVPAEVKRIVGRRRGFEEETTRPIRPDGTIFGQ